jgi:hypothetical protein
MNPLTTRLEDEFHKASNQARLRELHAAKDWNGLLEYALLLAELETMERTKASWFAKEAMSAPIPAVSDEHLRWACELLGELA